MFTSCDSQHKNHEQQNVEPFEGRMNHHPTFSLKNHKKNVLGSTEYPGTPINDN